MKRKNPISKLLQPLVLVVACFGFGFSFSSDFYVDKKLETISVTAFGDGFAAVSKNGSIKRISDDGKLVQSQAMQNVTFNTVAASEEYLVAAAVDGTIYYAKEDWGFKPIHSGTVKTVNCLTLFKNKVLAGYNSGELQIGSLDEKLEFANVELTGDILSLSSNEAYCYGLTNHGEIFYTSNGTEWNVIDFNEMYKGYYQTCTFSKILVTQNQIAVVGENTDGEPVLYFSSKGSVWTERPLVYTDEEGFKAKLNEIPRDIFYDTTHDQYLLLMEHGRLMTIPSCSHCHQLYKITEAEIQTISGNDKNIILVGENDYVQLINSDLL
ncbi:hypothetical protein [uncultured Draconibacterium sp.]|uniref:hypothetical protein n=1 Tax=uncultured Draconibacterium sp. TaxID=1573823 RepID=UPI0029C6A9C1|nr:hypothetical protein [uncultured Draconibacterium sp.]